MLSNFSVIQHVIEQKNSGGTFVKIPGLVDILPLQNYDIIFKQFLLDYEFNTQYDRTDALINKVEYHEKE